MHKIQLVSLACLVILTSRVAKLRRRRKRYISVPLRCTFKFTLACIGQCNHRITGLTGSAVCRLNETHRYGQEEGLIKEDDYLSGFLF